MTTYAKQHDLFRTAAQSLPVNDNAVSLRCAPESVPGWLYTFACGRVSARRSRWTGVSFSQKPEVQS